MKKKKIIYVLSEDQRINEKNEEHEIVTSVILGYFVILVMPFLSVMWTKLAMIYASDVFLGIPLMIYAIMHVLITAFLTIWCIVILAKKLINHICKRK